MALQLFEVERGFLHNGAALLAGAGAPPGTGDTGSVAIGSVYQDTSSGYFYIKRIAGAGAGNWSKLALSTELATGLSWREPALVADTSATSVPTGTAGSTITVDGVTVDDGDRVLFTAISGGSGPNVYVYTKATGTFAEDSNNESAGDNVYVISGTSAGKTFNYNSAGAWVLTNQANLDEEGYIRAFIGKASAGNTLPSYSSTNYVTNGDSLQTAVGKLDARAKTNADAISQEVTDRTNADTAIQNELDATQTGAGLNANGTYSANGTANYISTAVSLKNADNLLDAQLKTVADDVGTLQSSSATQAALLARARVETESLAVTAATTIDSVNVDTVAAAKWIVHVQGNASGDAANKQVVEILATHDGTGSADATATDYNVYAKLRMGSITGLSFSVDVSGTGAAQVMRLRVTSTMSADVRATREVIEF